MNEFSDKEIANVYDYFFHQTDDEDNQNKDEDSSISTDNSNENLFMLFVELQN